MTELVTSNERASHSHDGDAQACHACGCDDSYCATLNGAQDSLESRPLLATLLSLVPDLVLIVRRDGIIVDCHGPRTTQGKEATANLTGRNFREFVDPATSKQATYYLEKALRNGHTQKFTFTRESKGEFHEYHAHLARCASDQVLALVRDTTCEKLREKEIVEITSREQARIGQDLHDGLGQQLTGISFLSRALEQKLAGRSLPEAAEAAEICCLVRQTLSQTRNLARGLFPVELEGNGLVPALKQLGGEVEKLFGITCAVECHEGFLVEDCSTANHLFRLAQEAISNSVKHGKSKRVCVRLECLNGSAALSISDDGIGFRDNSAPGHGLGLRIMNYRAQKVGGTLDVRSSPSGGVHIRCTFPYNTPEPVQAGDSSAVDSL